VHLPRHWGGAIRCAQHHESRPTTKNETADHELGNPLGGRGDDHTREQKNAAGEDGLSAAILVGDYRGA
jgi:hypothetical protein